MTSRAFRQHIQPYFNRHTSHFLHELINFARSPFDIVGYDRNVQYRPHFYDTEIESVSIDSDRSDPSPRLSPRSDAEDPYMSNESQHTGHSRSVIVFGSNGEGSSSRIFTTPPSHMFQPITEPVLVDTDDSDDCMFVCEQKPPHLRTPVMVELNSDEDSDVMIIETEVKEENARPEQPIASTSSGSRVLLKPSASRRRTSTEDSDEAVNVTDRYEEIRKEIPSAPTRRKRKLQANDEDNRGAGEGPSRIKMIIRTQPNTSYSSTITTGELIDDSSEDATMSQENASFDGPAASVIRQPRNIPFKREKYTLYDASSESSGFDSTDSSSGEYTLEELKPLKQKRLTKKPCRKSVKLPNKNKLFNKTMHMKNKMKQMRRHLNCGAGESSSTTTSSSSSSDDTSDDEEKESSSDFN